MIVILALLLVAAVVVGVAGVLTNSGAAHSLPHHGFAVFGYHVTGSTGALFLYGIVVGAIGLLGLSLLLAAARRTARRGRAARRRLTMSRRETAAVSKDRDELIDQRETARAVTASDLRSDSGSGGGHSALRLFGHRSAPRRSAVTQPEPLASQRAADAPADASATAR